MYRRLIKKSCDFIGALIGIIFLSPLFIIVYIVLLINNRGGVFFTQVRPGKDEVPFKLVKFKTMTDKKDNSGVLLSDAKRLTKVGAAIRKLSLDELPQLLNVLKGDMSLVGPRPLLTEYLQLYSDDQRKRHLVKPGITGWAQVNGRNSIGWKQKFEYDVWYVHNQSFIVDLKILFLTIKKVVIRDGISSDTSVTMEPFKGSN